ncbi:hypothetical protein [Streptomyces sp. NPDC088757]|uniref:hypothetical protein n=1 Tax=Streptomyces sp. NPDC088757 TaxID=3365889 RepID=UPI00380F7C80
MACRGGRHRSVAAAEAVGRLVREAWDGEYGIDIEHHHIDRPVPTSSHLRSTRSAIKRRPPLLRLPCPLGFWGSESFTTAITPPTASPPIARPTTRPLMNGRLRWGDTLGGSSGIGGMGDVSALMGGLFSMFLRSADMACKLQSGDILGELTTSASSESL